MQTLVEIVKGWPVGLAFLLAALACSSVFRAVAESLEHSPADTWLLRWALVAPPRWQPLAVWLNKWADRSNSWKNKYKPGTEFGTLQRRFPGSTTWLVWVTDLWHLANSLELLSWQVAIVALLPLPPTAWHWGQGLALLLVKGWPAAVFEGVYRLIRPSK